MGQFTNAEKAREAEREVQMRQWVYAKNKEGMTGLDKMRIAIMQEIADDYAAQAEKERLL